MKNLLVILFVFASAAAMAQEFKIITTVESIVPMGLGRSYRTQTPLGAASYDDSTCEQFQNTVYLNRSRTKRLVDHLDQDKHLFSVSIGRTYHSARNRARLGSRIQTRSRHLSKRPSSKHSS